MEPSSRVANVVTSLRYIHGPFPARGTASDVTRAAQFELYGRKKIGTRMGPYIFWRAMCRMHECRDGNGWPRAAPERLASRYAARLVVAALLGTNAALRAAQFELYGRKKIGTRMGPYVVIDR